MLYIIIIFPEFLPYPRYNYTNIALCESGQLFYLFYASSVHCHLHNSSMLLRKAAEEVCDEFFCLFGFYARWRWQLNLFNVCQRVVPFGSYCPPAVDADVAQQCAAVGKRGGKGVKILFLFPQLQIEVLQRIFGLEAIAEHTVCFPIKLLL